MSEILENKVASILSLHNIGYTLLGLFAIVFMFSSYSYNDSGVSTRLQQPIFGYKWIKEEGYFFKLPLVSRTKSYNQRGTIASTSNESIIETSLLYTAPANLQFADSYEMNVEWSMRYSIPTSDEDLEAMHKAVKSESNLLGNTIMPFATTLVADTAGQMLGGNFAQGGRNQFRSLVDNQSQNGMYVTKVEKVKINTERADSSKDRDGDTKLDEQFVRKVVYITDANGRKERRSLSISQYGITIVPNSFNLLKAAPIGRLVDYIDRKQDNIAKQIKQEENQKLLREEAKTQQLEGERDLITKTNQLKIDKESAIIAAEKKVAEAKLQAEREIIERQKVADLAIIDKKRELQIAKDNEGIQKANAIAAKYEGQAILEKGLAEAKVTKAKYQAIDKEIKLAELSLQETEALTKVLPSVRFDAPDVVINGSGGNTPTSDLLNVKLVSDIVSGLSNNKESDVKK